MSKKLLITFSFLFIISIYANALPEIPKDANLIIADDCENASSKETWSFMGAKGNISIETNNKINGRGSLKFQIDEGNAGRFSAIYKKLKFPIDASKVSNIKFNIYLPAKNLSSDNCMILLYDTEGIAKNAKAVLKSQIDIAAKKWTEIIFKTETTGAAAIVGLRIYFSYKDKNNITTGDYFFIDSFTINAPAGEIIDLKKTNEFVLKKYRKPFDVKVLDNNVKTYGAMGDGKTDDTDSLQRAIMALEAYSPSYDNENACPEIIFPEGTYLISRPLVIALTKQNRALVLKGVGKALIKQKNSDQDILYFHKGYRHAVENISFECGKIQIKFFTANTDISQLLVRNCKFANSSSYAIDDSLKGMHYTNIIAPYNVIIKNKLPILEVNEIDSLPDVIYTSSIVNIENCEFNNCHNAVRIFADWGIISDCKIETSPEMENAAIYSQGVLKLKNIEGVANVKAGKNQRWIDNIMAGVIMQNVHFTAKGNIGMCPIYNRGIYDNGGMNNSYITITDSSFYTKSSPENCIIYCDEFPNLIAVNKSRKISKEISGIKVPILGFRTPLTLEYLQYVDYSQLVKRDSELERIYGYMVRMPRKYNLVSEAGEKFNNAFSLSISDNDPSLSSEVPDILKQFIDKPLPNDIEKLFIKKERITLNTMNSLIQKSINVSDFGALPNGQDATAAIQKAFDTVNEGIMTEVLFPNGIYAVSKEIQLPKNIALRGLGNACFEGEPGLKSLLTGKNVQNLLIRNFGFYDNENAIEITTETKEDSKILIDFCRFTKIHETGVIRRERYRAY